MQLYSKDDSATTYKYGRNKMMRQTGRRTDGQTDREVDRLGDKVTTVYLNYVYRKCEYICILTGI